MKEYKVVIIKEGGISTLLFGTGKLPPLKIEETLNTLAKEGWSLEFMLIEQRRLFWFWEREVAVITMARSLQAA